MANPEHLTILQKGIDQWNHWRQAQPDIRPRLSDAQLTQADLRKANLRYTNLSGADLRSANLTEANLAGADLRLADLTSANLSMVNLNGANLSGAQLILADFTGADLRWSTFIAANLGHANLSGARFSGVVLVNVDMSTTKGLNSIEHFGPSSIGIDTIYKSGGNLPEVFLRGVGVPDNFVTYIGSLTGRPIEFYSCFISYSKSDQEFADRLYADLQAKGVRCWFAPEDLKMGDKFRDRIDESIRMHDKLLIVLSEHSIASGWVRREVEAAMEREDRQKELVLLPLRIDDAAMATDDAWTADIRRTRHIGDFSRWKHHDSYQKAFDRLLRDLKAEVRNL